MRLYYTLTNLDALVISQSSASTNNHECLDYIPGSAILGAVAAHLYPTLTTQQAMAMFHNGTCRFGPAYPVHDGEVALPVPASWHGIKGNSNELSNHTAPYFVRQQNKQYQQKRSGYITSKNESATVEHNLTTRTALDADTQRAKDGQLYSYASIAPNQHFSGWVEADDVALLEMIKPLLNGQLRIGRSRSSEFGRVQLHTPDQQPKLTQVKSNGQQLIIWCLSDVECKDSWGMPTLAPTATDIHPELNGVLDAERSFIRTHKVRRFNRARGGFDTEQQLISRGSVLAFTLEQPASQALLTELAKQGIGCHRQQGLGWVSINPNWSALSELDAGSLFNSLTIAQPIAKPLANTPPSTLLQWVSVQQQLVQAQRSQAEQLQELYAQIYHAYHNARVYNHIPFSYQAGPSSSQWRRLSELVRNRNSNDWQEAAFGTNPIDKKDDAAICKAHNDEFGWGIGWQENGTPLNFASKMKQILSPLDIATMRQLLENLCRFDVSTNEGLTRFKQTHVATQQGAQ